MSEVSNYSWATGYDFLRSRAKYLDLLDLISPAKNDNKNTSPYQLNAVYQDGTEGLYSQGFFSAEARTGQWQLGLEGQYLGSPDKGEGGESSNALGVSAEHKITSSLSFRAGIKRVQQNITAFGDGEELSSESISRGGADLEIKSDQGIVKQVAISDISLGSGGLPLPTALDVILGKEIKVGKNVDVDVTGRYNHLFFNDRNKYELSAKVNFEAASLKARVEATSLKFGLEYDPASKVFVPTFGGGVRTVNYGIGFSFSYDHRYLTPSIWTGATFFLGKNEAAPVTGLIEAKPEKQAGKIAPITDLTAKQGDQAGEINLTWTAPENVASYTVQYSTDTKFKTGIKESAKPWVTFAQSGNTENRVFAGLTPGTTYYIRVIPKDKNGNAAKPNKPVPAWASVAPAKIEEIKKPEPKPEPVIDTSEEDKKLLENTAVPFKAGLSDPKDPGVLASALSIIKEFHAKYPGKQITISIDRETVQRSNKAATLWQSNNLQGNRKAKTENELKKIEGLFNVTVSTSAQKGNSIRFKVKEEGIK